MDQFVNKLSFRNSTPDTAKDHQIEIELLEKGAISTVAPIWKRLEGEVSRVALTSTWDWVETWLAVYGELVDYWFAIGKVDNAYVGIALITRETHRPLPLPVKAFHLSTNGEPYQDQMQMMNNCMLVKATWMMPFYDAVINTVMDMFKPEELIFDDYAPEIANELIAHLQKQNYTISVDRNTTLYLDLDVVRKSGSDLLSHFSSSMRYAIRRSLKTLDDLSVEVAETNDQAMDILDELIVLYEESWHKLGRDGVFSSAYYLKFTRTIIKKLLHKNGAMLLRVKSKQFGTIGCYYVLVDNGTAYFTQLGVVDTDKIATDDISKNRLKVGYVVHALCMEACLQRGLKAYNFSIGIFPYKKQLSNAEAEVISISVRKSLKPVIRNFILQCYAKLDANRKTPFILKMIRAVVKR